MKTHEVEDRKLARDKLTKMRLKKKRNRKGVKAEDEGEENDQEMEAVLGTPEESDAGE